MDEWLKGWLASESAEQDKIMVKRVYIDINDGNLTDGVLFSQIMYWHGINQETGKPRLTISRNGHLWLAKNFKDWWGECRIDERTAKRAMVRMEQRGLIETQVWKYGDNRITHIRIIWEQFKECIFKVTNLSDKVTDLSSKVTKRNFAKGQNVPLQSDKMVVSSYTETTTETIAKTTTEKDRTLSEVPSDAPPVSEPTSEKKAERPKNPLQEAVCFAFYLKPGGYAGKLGKWLTGGSVEGEEYQRYPIEEPATPEEIVGWRLWLEDKYDDADKAKRFRPQKIKGIHESFEDHFRGAADHEKWLKKGAKQLDRLLGIQRVVFEPAPDVRPPLAVNVPATPDNDDFESFNAEIEAGVAELVRIFSDHAGASNEKDRAYLLARKQAYLESQQKRAG